MECSPGETKTVVAELAIPVPVRMPLACIVWKVGKVSETLLMLVRNGWKFAAW
jgi:hypothetical protein